MRGILLILIFSSTVWAAKTGLRDKALKLFPSDIKNLLIGKDLLRFKQAHSKKISSSSSDQATFLKYFGNKNDVTIGQSKGKISYLYLEIPSSLRQQAQGLYAETLKSLTPKEKKIFEKEPVSGGHDAGRFIVINVPSQKIQLKFYANEAHDLHSVIAWPLEKK